MKKILGAFLGLIALVIIGAVGVLAFSGTSDNPVGDVAQDAKNTALNAAIDATGMKDQVKGLIDAHRDDIATATGLSGSELDAAISNLDIDSWQAATLPSDANATGTIDGATVGLDGSLTTYDDPSYVTVEAYGQTITLEVPESAQQYLPYLAYVQ